MTNPSYSTTQFEAEVTAAWAKYSASRRKFNFIEIFLAVTLLFLIVIFEGNLANLKPLLIASLAACCLVGIALCRIQIYKLESNYFAEYPSLDPNAE